MRVATTRIILVNDFALLLELTAGCTFVAT
jgi:hypothetical protein